MRDIELKIRRQIGDGEMYIKLTIDEGEELLEYLDRSYDIEDDLRETNQVVISLNKQLVQLNDDNWELRCSLRSSRDSIVD